MVSSSEEQSAQLEMAIAGLEAQRSVLGDAVVEPALAAWRQQLIDLRAAVLPKPAPISEGEAK